MDRVEPFLDSPINEAAPSAPFQTPPATVDTPVDPPRTNRTLPGYVGTLAEVAEPSTTHPLVGKTVGEYFILEMAGRGGMGEVFKALQPETGQTVAIKMIRDSQFGNREIVARFRQEVQSLGRVQPAANIVPIYHVGSHDGELFYVMPFLAQGSLSKHLARFQKDARMAIALMEKLTRAVHRLHVNEIVHRDIKPSNILLDADDEPFLGDFGLVKILDNDQTLTHGDQRLGTPAYMAPEQTGLKRTAVRAPADIWALGVLLYELVAGRRPFEMQTEQETATLLNKIVHDEPRSPRKLQSSIDADLEAVILKCLEKDPADRFQSAADLADELERWLSGLPLRTHPPTRTTRVLRWSRAHAGKVALCLALLFGVAAAMSMNFLSDPERQIERMQNELAADRTVVLIAAEGKPRYRRMLTPAAGMEKISEDGYYTVVSDGLCLVEMMRGVPTPTYRLQAKMRHNLGGPTSKAGLFLSHSGSADKDGQAHFFYRLTYDDVNYSFTPKLKLMGLPEVPPVNTNPASFGFSLYAALPGTPLAPNIDLSFMPLRFLPGGPRGKQWREIAIEVHDDRVEVVFDGKRTSHTIVLCNKAGNWRADDYFGKHPQHQWIGERFAPHFTPDASLGIVVVGGSVSVTDVSITPLPRMNGENQ